MREREFRREPDCTMRGGLAMAIFDAALPREQMPELPCALGLDAVIEEEGGVKSYWALCACRRKARFPRSRLASPRKLAARKAA